MKKRFTVFMMALILGSTSVLGVQATTVENTAVSGVSSITLKAEGAYVSWTTEGTSKEGFKIVWSKNANPTYPTREGDRYKYESNPGARDAKIEPFAVNAGPYYGTFYVRVCEYLNGQCGTYSNEVTTVITGDTADNQKKAKEAGFSGDYEKIPSIDAIRYYSHIQKRGQDLYGIKLDNKVAKTNKEKIVRIEDVKYFKNIEKIGDSLYGQRIDGGKKDAIQKKLNMLSEQMKKLQAEIEMLNKELETTE